MEKTKFVAQVLLLTAVIPVLFIGTIMGNDARIKARQTKEHSYMSYTANGKTRTFISCSNRMAYVKKFIKTRKPL